MLLHTLLVLWATALTASVQAQPPPSVPLPEWDSLPQIQRAFELMRDAQVVPDPNLGPTINRRMNWIYAPDGCSQRAYISARVISQAAEHFPPVGQVFIDGSRGEIRAHPLWSTVPAQSFYPWTYHQAVGVRVGQQNYVLDPALDSWGPLPLEDWAHRVAPGGGARIRTCGPYALSEESCGRMRPYSPNSSTYQHIIQILQQQHRSERFHLQYTLHLDPEMVYGDHPPWKYTQACRRAAPPQSPLWQNLPTLDGQPLHWAAPLQWQTNLTTSVMTGGEAVWLRAWVHSRAPGAQTVVTFVHGLGHSLRFWLSDAEPAYQTEPVCVAASSGIRIDVQPDYSDATERQITIDRFEVHPAVL